MNIDMQEIAAMEEEIFSLIGGQPVESFPLKIEQPVSNPPAEQSNF